MEAGIIRGCSSVGRAPALQAGGHEFESHHLHEGNEKRELRDGQDQAIALAQMSLRLSGSEGVRRTPVMNKCEAFMNPVPVLHKLPYVP